MPLGGPLDGMEMRVVPSRRHRTRPRRSRPCQPSVDGRCVHRRPTVVLESTGHHPCRHPRRRSPWVLIALHGTAAQIDRLASAFRKVTRQDALDQIASTGLVVAHRGRRSSHFTLRVPAEAAMAVIMCGGHRDRTRQGSRIDPNSAPRPPCGSSPAMPRGPAEVVVHVHDDHAHLQDGPAIHPDLADCLACDAPVTTVTDTPTGPRGQEHRRKAPTKRQRSGSATRHPPLSVPRVPPHGRFDVHHVVERRHGGETKFANLVRVCALPSPHGPPPPTDPHPPPRPTPRVSTEPTAPPSTKTSPTTSGTQPRSRTPTGSAAMVRRPPLHPRLLRRPRPRPPLPRETPHPPTRLRSAPAHPDFLRDGGRRPRRRHVLLVSLGPLPCGSRVPTAAHSCPNHREARQVLGLRSR